MRRRLPFARTLAVLVGSFVLVAAAILFLWKIDRVVVAPGRIFGGSVVVHAPRDGAVSEVLARAGERVAAGAVLVRLDTHDLVADLGERTARLEALEAQREAKRAETKQLVESLIPRERAEAVAARETARVALKRTEIETRATRELGEEGIVGRLEVERAELDLELATMALESATDAVPLLAAQHRARLESLEAEVRRLDGEIAAERVAKEAAATRIAKSEVKSPMAGSVEAAALEELPGRAFREGDEILRLHVDSPSRFEGTLTDTGRAAVRAGQRVRIRLDAYPWLIHGARPGTVARVADRRERGEGFRVEVEMDPAGKPGPLEEGMLGTARIVIQERVSLGQLLLERIAGRSGP